MWSRSVSCDEYASHPEGAGVLVGNRRSLLRVPSPSAALCYFSLTPNARASLVNIG